MQCGERPQARRSGRRSRASEARGTRHGLMGIAVSRREDWRLRVDGRRAPAGSHAASMRTSRVRAPRPECRSRALNPGFVWRLLAHGWQGRADQRVLTRNPRAVERKPGRQRNPCLGPRGDDSGFRPKGSPQQIQPLVKPGMDPRPKHSEGEEQKKSLAWRRSTQMILRLGPSPWS